MGIERSVGSGSPGVCTLGYFRSPRWGLWAIKIGSGEGGRWGLKDQLVRDLQGFAPLAIFGRPVGAEDDARMMVILPARNKM